MTKTSIVAIGIGCIVIIGIAYSLMTGDSAMRKEESEAMMQNSDTVSAEAMEKNEETMMDGRDGADAMMKKGSYEVYEAQMLARANTGDVVLFFRATWCPTCKAVDADIRAHMSAIPPSLTILDVNYDNSTELKQKYGVTYQHTFVQVAADGTLIKKWSGSQTLASLVAEVQ